MRGTNALTRSANPGRVGAHDTIRTCGLRLRRVVLIQLNYGCINIQTVSEIEQGQSRIQQSNPLEHSGLRCLIGRFDERGGKFKMKMDSFQREANSQGAADQLLGANAPPSDHDDRPCSRARGSVRCAWGRHA